jgi:hypothetical protein
MKRILDIKERKPKSLATPSHMSAKQFAKCGDGGGSCGRCSGGCSN